MHVSRPTAIGEMGSSIAHEDQPAALRNYKLHARTKALLAPDEPDANCIGDALEHAAEEALLANDIIKRLRKFVARGGRTVESPLTLLEQAVALA